MRVNACSRASPRLSLGSVVRSSLLLLFRVLVASAVLLASGGMARATIVERVVAVIGERPLLWTELLHRAAATRVQIRMQTQDPNVVSVQEQEMYKELLDRMIDDRLEEQQADKAHIAITPEEIDRGIANIAAQAQQQQSHTVTAADVLEEVRHRGLSEQDFREEIRRQILEGKLIELRVRARVRVTDQDAHAAYQHWVAELRDQQLVDVCVLARETRAAPGSTPQPTQAVLTLAADARARGPVGGRTSASSSRSTATIRFDARQTRAARGVRSRSTTSCPPSRSYVRDGAAGARCPTPPPSASAPTTSWSSPCRCRRPASPRTTRR